MRRHNLDKEIGSEDHSTGKMPRGSKELLFEVEGFRVGLAQWVSRADVGELQVECGPWWGTERFCCYSKRSFPLLNVLGEDLSGDGLCVRNEEQFTSESDLLECDSDWAGR